MDIIKTAATIPTIKRFVYTSSSTATTLPYPNKEFTIEHDTWNEPAVQQAWAPAPYESTRSYAVYAASKTQTEQALWKFVKEEKPSFVLNTGMNQFGET
jgi:nucleoside-diphosphate-sugar epimerase